MSTETTQLPTEPTKTPEQMNDPTPLPEEIKGGFSFSNPFGTTNTEDIKISSQNEIAELNTQIQALDAEIKSKTLELEIKKDRLKKLNPKKGFFGGKKSKKTHKKTHKKSSRKTR